MQHWIRESYFPNLGDMPREALDDHLKKMVKRIGKVRLIREEST
jgi:hypothetical protein